MRTRHVLLLVILLVGLGAGSLRADQATEKAVSSDARAWLSLIDNGNYSESWKEAATYFQNAVSEQQWASSLKAVRQPLGKTIRRALVKSMQANSLPGAPDGSYVVMSFETVFEHKKAAVETVTFMLDKDGKWRAAGYYIK